MSIYIFQSFNRLPVEVFNHIMSYMGKSPTAELLHRKCNNYKHYEFRYDNYLQSVLCKNGFYSYMKFKHSSFLSRKNHYDLIFANWLYENPEMKVNKFFGYYKEYSISSIVEAQDAGLGETMLKFIAGNTPKFIISYIFCNYINDKLTYFVGFDFIDLLRMYHYDQSFIEEQIGFFRNCEFNKINDLQFINYIDNLENYDSDYDSDDDSNNEDDDNFTDN